MYNEEKIISTLSTIQEICFTDLNSVERILTLSNLLLIEAEVYLPPELQKDSKQLLSNGRRIKYELLKFNDNLGLNLGLMAHTIISDINKQLEGGYE